MRGRTGLRTVGAQARHVAITEKRKRFLLLPRRLLLRVYPLQVQTPKAHGGKSTFHTETTVACPADHENLRQDRYSLSVTWILFMSFLMDEAAL